MKVAGENVPEWSVLVVPAIAKGTGTGHLKRSMALVRTLRGAGKDAWLYLAAAGKAASWTRAEILDSFSGELDPFSIFEGAPASRK